MISDVPPIEICMACPAAVVESWKQIPGGELAAVIGTLDAHAEEIVLCGAWGGKRKLILPEGDPLPRIC